ncbi:hypothetical protein ACFL0L_02345 [Patescibacteria group bacterium]
MKISNLSKPPDLQDEDRQQHPPSPRTFWVVFVLIFLVMTGLVLWQGVWYERSEIAELVNTEGATETVKMKDISLELVLKNVQPLEKGHFEAWVSDGITPQSIGRFNINSEGLFEDLDFKPIAENTFSFETEKTKELSRVFVTIEQTGDDDSTPSDIEFLSGKIVDDVAELAFSAFDFTEASGSYILLTPTNDPDEELEQSGIWFFIPENPFRTSLILNDAPTGWTYEAWIDQDGKAFSVGRFSSVVGKDSSSDFSGEQEGPAFPGEDFLQNPPEGFTFPLYLADGSFQVFISIEPDISGFDPTGGAPFQLQPLFDTIPENLEDRTAEELEQSLDNIPEGVATFQ